MLCNYCSNEFEPPHFNSKCCSDECRAKSRIRAKSKYRKTDKGNIAHKKWVNSDKRKANEKRYRQKPVAKRLAVIRSAKCLANSPPLQKAKRIRDKSFGKTIRGRKINNIASKKYAQTPEGKISQINGKSRRRQLESKGKVTAKEWAEKLKEHDYCCINCGIDENIEMDHIIPLSKGGAHHIDNIQPLCRSCNASKGSKLQWAG